MRPASRSWLYYAEAVLSWEIPDGFAFAEDTVPIAWFPEWMVPTADAGVVGFALTVRHAMNGPNGPQWVTLSRLFRRLWDHELHEWIGNPVFIWSPSSSTVLRDR